MDTTPEIRQRDWMVWGLGMAVALLVLILLGAWMWNRRSSPALPAPRLGAPAEVRSLLDLEGRRVELFDGRQGVVLCFFTLSCPGCVGESETWRELSRRGRERHVRVFLVTAGVAPREIQRFALANSVDDLTVLHDPSGDLFQRFHIAGVPEYLTFDRHGTLHDFSLGDSAPQGFTPQRRAEAVLAALDRVAP